MNLVVKIEVSAGVGHLTVIFDWSMGRRCLRHSQPMKIVYRLDVKLKHSDTTRKQEHASWICYLITHVYQERTLAQHGSQDLSLVERTPLWLKSSNIISGASTKTTRQSVFGFASSSVDSRSARELQELLQQEVLSTLLPPSHNWRGLLCYLPK